MKLEYIKKKIFSTEVLKRQMASWHLLGNKIVFTNGCFDLVHPGHIHTLTAAADFGNKLIVALNTDASVKKIKGDPRPLQAEASRALIMASFQFVDAVILFDEATPLALIKELQPDVLVKGGDYKKEEVIGYTEMLSWGGSVEIVPLLTGFSTTILEKKVKG